MWRSPKARACSPAAAQRWPLPGAEPAADDRSGVVPVGDRGHTDEVGVNRTAVTYSIADGAYPTAGTPEPYTDAERHAQAHSQADTHADGNP